MSADFFQSVVAMPPAAEQVVVVTHLLPGVEDFIFSLHRSIRIAAIIPKPNSINKKTYAAIKGKIPLLEVDRAFIKKHPEAFLKKIEEATHGQKYSVIDTGGYFSHVISNRISQSRNALQELSRTRRTATKNMKMHYFKANPENSPVR